MHSHGTRKMLHNAPYLRCRQLSLNSWQQLPRKHTFRQDAHSGTEMEIGAKLNACSKQYCNAYLLAQTQKQCSTHALLARQLTVLRPMPQLYCATPFASHRREVLAELSGAMGPAAPDDLQRNCFEVSRQLCWPLGTRTATGPGDIRRTIRSQPGLGRLVNMSVHGTQRQLKLFAPV